MTKIRILNLKFNGLARLRPIGVALFCVSAVSLAIGSTFDFVETFEGSSQDSQSVSGYDNTGWTSSSSLNDPNYATAPAPLEGSNSLYSSNGVRYIERSVAAADELWVYCRMVGTVESDFERNLITLLNADGSETLGKVSGRSDYLEFYASNGSVSDMTSLDKWPAHDTEMHIWLHWKRSTGGNGVTELWTSTDGTRPPSADRVISNGDATSQVEKVRFGFLSLAIIDSIVIHSSEIGNSPLGDTYLIEEGFEEVDSGGALGSATDGYDSPLVSAEVFTTGSINPDHGNTDGERVQVDGRNGEDTYVEWDLGRDYNELWIYFVVDKKGNTYNRSIFKFFNDSGSEVLDGNISTSSRLLDIGVDNSIGFGSGASVWIHYQAGGVKELFLSTDGVRPSSGSNYGTGTAGSSGIRKLRFGIFNKYNTWGYDRLLVSENEIGDNPWDSLGNALPEVTSLTHSPAIGEDDTSLAVASNLTIGNDTDGDSLSITNVEQGANSGTSGQAVQGTYGVLTVTDNGDDTYDYTYDLDEGTAVVDAVRTGATVQDVFTISVSDGVGADVTFDLSFDVSGVNDLPVLANPIASIPGAQAGDASYSHTLASSHYTDAEDAPAAFTWNLSGDALPSWLNFDSSTGAFSSNAAVPSDGDATYNFSIAVTDADSGASQSDAFTFVVSPLPNNAPTLDNPVADQAATEGAAFSFTLSLGTFSDLDADALTWTVTESLPWLTVDNNNSTTPPTLHGTPGSSDVGGPFTISVKVNDGQADSPIDSFDITVEAASTEGSTNEQLFTNTVTGTTGADGSRIDLSDSDLVIENHESASIRLSTAGSERLVVDANGTVTVNAAGASANALDVDGTVRAKKVMVDADWADFVFEEGYKLKTLGEIETYIAEHGHLPDMPSAEVVKREGVSIGESQSLLLQKVEELMLYIIDQEKRIQELERQLEANKQDSE